MLKLAALTDYVTLGQELNGMNEWRIEFEQQLEQAFQAGTSIRTILAARTAQIDHALTFVWQHTGLDNTSLGLFAIGGYGRAEMLPYSDVDVLVLSEAELDAVTAKKVEQFVSLLWDVGHFKPAISVHSLKSCYAKAKEDLSVATSLIEARLLSGNASLKKYPRRIVAESWTDKTFFDAKMQEQEKRHAQHHYTESNLEPDIKNAPGGLRDIHQIGWIAKRHFRVQRIYDLVHLGFISEFELDILEQAESFLWEIRHYLHQLKKRDENRLLFDYQREIAAKMGYSRVEGQHPNHAIEQFMKRYYRTAQAVSTLNELLLHYFNEAVITPRLPDYERQIIEINKNFKLVDGKLAVTHHKVFSESPRTILEIFYLMANYPDIQGIRARTLRLLLLAAKKVDRTFREDPAHQLLFLEIIRSPYRLYETLVAMKRYGILGQYIPAFGQIIGLMQYDLFHIYTVDAHTLLLIRNLQRFVDAETAPLFPVVSQVFQRIQRKDILFLAALFHDIAKGRGGDHSELGAVDAIEFCRQHNLSEREAKIVAWLTRNHLLMSLVAQKKDISDPDVVQDFAEQVGDIEHLDYLYCLTASDINSTNPALWTNWKASLLRQLYAATREVIRTGIDRPVDHQTLIEETKAAALHQLSHEFSHEDVTHVWCELGDDYFLKESADEIAWHTTAILRHGDNTRPLVLIREHNKAIQVFIYTQDAPNLFARTVAILDRLNLDVQDARIITAATNFSLDTYVVQDPFGILMHDAEYMSQAIAQLVDGLQRAEYPKMIQRLIPRQLRHFEVETTVDIRLNHALQQNMVEISTLDQPGLLARIGRFFMQQGLDIHSAKIATLGEKAEDIFFVTKPDGTALDNLESATLAQQLKQALDEASNEVTAN